LAVRGHVEFNGEGVVEVADGLVGDDAPEDGDAEGVLPGW
jgi:hypothetical protein